jgi:O-antigen/teichoic acid export membrane protein
MRSLARSPAVSSRAKEAPATPKVLRARWLGGVGRTVGLAVVEQGTFAGSLFLITLVLARWMSAEAFGAFTVGYVIYLLFQNLFEAVVTEPLGIFGAGRYRDLLKAYVGRVFCGQLAIGLFTAALVEIVALGVLFVGASGVAAAVAGAGAALPFLVARSLTRQPLYTISRLEWSIVAWVVFLVLAVGALAALQYAGVLRPFSAFLALGAASGIGSAIPILCCIKPEWATTEPKLSPRALLAAHLCYGRWALCERALQWLAANIYYLQLPLQADLHTSAALRVLNILAMPAAMSLNAICAVILPILVRLEVDHGREVLKRRMRLLLPAVSGVAVAYAVLLVVCGQEVASLLYQRQYDADLTLSLLMVTGLSIILTAVTSVIEVSLRARLQIKRVFLARIASTAILASLGLAATARFGLIGAAAASASALVVQLVGLFLFQSGTRTAGCAAMSDE